MQNPVEIIRKKRDGKVLTAKEIEDFFSDFLLDKVADYQVSSWLMAAFINGLSADETATLMRVMRDSGRTLKWSSNTRVVDKHSTGGVGDKTSLVVLPLCVLEGLTVPMISGRGLGHSGGTLDKLESIPGINVFLNEKQARTVIAKFGGAFMGQTEEFAPLDKRLYALRDVTGTVESIELITASILSKKSAEGLSGLVMDVKFGSGAFMPSLDRARLLAQSIMRVGEANGLAVTSLLTDMNSPLGDAAGNALEVKECLAVLQGGGPDSTRLLSIRLAAEMVALVNTKEDIADIEQRMIGYLEDGSAYERFCQIIDAQGGNTKALATPDLLPKAARQLPVIAQTDGYIATIDVRALGLATVELGGGRRKVTDKVDFGAGLAALKHVGEYVSRGEPLAIIHTNKASGNDTIAELVRSAYTVAADAQHRPLIAEVIK
jgi:thymidine phosphorylase